MWLFNTDYITITLLSWKLSFVELVFGHFDAAQEVKHKSARCNEIYKHLTDQSSRLRGRHDELAPVFIDKYSPSRRPGGYLRGAR